MKICHIWRKTTFVHSQTTTVDERWFLVYNIHMRNVDQSEINRITENIQSRQINLNLDNMVVMANDMIKGATSLTLNEAKLLRLIIMQIKPDDCELMKFSIRADEFAGILGIDKSNLYRELDRMSEHLLKEVIKIGDGNPRHKWKKFQWVSCCEYDSGVITIRLNDELKPYIIGLQEWYTQYRLDEIVGFRSVYSIKIYELINVALMNRKPYADKQVKVYIDLCTMRKATNTENKFERISQFKSKVIDISIKDINTYSPYHVTVEAYKESRSIVGFYFTVESHAGFEHRIAMEQKKSERQMELDDYLDENY